MEGQRTGKTRGDGILLNHDASPWLESEPQQVSKLWGEWWICRTKPWAGKTHPRRGWHQWACGLDGIERVRRRPALLFLEKLCLCPRLPLDLSLQQLGAGSRNLRFLRHGLTLPSTGSTGFHLQAVPHSLHPALLCPCISHASGGHSMPSWQSFWIIISILY